MSMRRYRDQAALDAWDDEQFDKSLGAALPFFNNMALRVQEQADLVDCQRCARAIGDPCGQIGASVFNCIDRRKRSAFEALARSERTDDA